MKHKAKRAASLALGLGLALQLGTAASAQGLPTGGYENGTAARLGGIPPASSAWTAA